MGNVKGFKQVIKALRAKVAKQEKGFARGLIEAGLLLQRASMKIVPIHTGNLRASGQAYPVVLGTGFDTEVFAGYDAEHAIYVHEDLEALHGMAFNAAYADKIKEVNKARRKAGKKGKHPYWFKRGKDQQAKFLEQPARELRKEMGAIVRARMQGKARL